MTCLERRDFFDDYIQLNTNQVSLTLYRNVSLSGYEVQFFSSEFIWCLLFSNPMQKPGENSMLHNFGLVSTFETIKKMMSI